MPTLLYISTVLSFTHSITFSRALGLEALTPCALTASDGAVVQAYCEETITPCVLTGSNGAIVSAYCEPGLVSQPFASISGTSALQNTSGASSLFQILGTGSTSVSERRYPCIWGGIDDDVECLQISYNGKTNPTTHLSPTSAIKNTPFPSPNPSTDPGTSHPLTNASNALLPSPDSSTTSSKPLSVATTNIPSLPTSNLSAPSVTSLSSTTTALSYLANLTQTTASNVCCSSLVFRNVYAHQKTETAAQRTGIPYHRLPRKHRTRRRRTVLRTRVSPLPSYHQRPTLDKSLAQRRSRLPPRELLHLFRRKHVRDPDPRVDASVALQPLPVHVRIHAADDGSAGAIGLRVRWTGQLQHDEQSEHPVHHQRSKRHVRPGRDIKLQHLHLPRRLSRGQRCRGGGQLHRILQHHIPHAMVVERERSPLHQRHERRLRQLFLRPDLGRQLELFRPVCQLVLRRAQHHLVQTRREPNPRLLRRVEHLQLRHLVLFLLHGRAVRVQLHDGDDLERHARL